MGEGSSAFWAGTRRYMAPEMLARVHHDPCRLEPLPPAPHHSQGGRVVCRGAAL